MKNYKKRYKREKKHSFSLIKRCYELETQINALVETYQKIFEDRPTISAKEWLEEDKKRESKRGVQTRQRPRGVHAIRAKNPRPTQARAEQP